MKDFVRKMPFFYGWVVMAAGTIGIIMTSPAQTYTVSIFIEYIIEELEISRSMISTLYSLGTLVGGFTLPFWGRQVDRRGSRVMVTVVAFLFGLACIYMGYVQNAFMLGIGFILIRMLGQGSLGLVSQNAINQWWVRRRGMVMGISGLFLAVLGLGAFPNLVYWLISTFEWRAAYQVLGLLLLIFMAPMGYLLYRDRPEDHQLQPDGAPLDEKTNILPGKEQVAEENWTLKEAMRTYSFWILVASFGTFTMLSTGLFFHMVSIFAARGLGPSIAATVYVPVSIASALATLGAGFLADRIPFRFILSAGLLLQAGSVVFAVYLQDAVSAFLFGTLVGVTNGVFRTVSSYAWPSFFGRRYLGSIYGFTSAVGVLGAALGPLPFGIVYDLTGTYQGTLLASAGISLLFFLIGFFVRKPERLSSI